MSIKVLKGKLGEHTGSGG